MPRVFLHDALHSKLVRSLSAIDVAHALRPGIGVETHLREGSHHEVDAHEHHEAEEEVVSYKDSTFTGVIGSFNVGAAVEGGVGHDQSEQDFEDHLLPYSRIYYVVQFEERVGTLPSYKQLITSNNRQK